MRWTSPCRLRGWWSRARQQRGPGGRAPGVLLVAPPPIIEVGDLGLMFAGGAAKSATLAQRIAEVARRLDVPFVDAGALIGVSPIDGIHYDEPAMAALAQGFAAALQQNFAEGAGHVKGIDNRLNADVLQALRAMGHGDTIVIADTTSRPTTSRGKRPSARCCAWKT